MGLGVAGSPDSLGFLLVCFTRLAIEAAARACPGVSRACDQDAVSHSLFALAAESTGFIRTKAEIVTLTADVDCVVVFGAEVISAVVAGLLLVEGSFASRAVVAVARMLVESLADAAQHARLAVYVVVEYPLVLEVLGLAVKAGLD